MIFAVQYASIVLSWSSRPCEKKSFISGCLLKDLVLTRRIKVAAGVETGQNVCCRHSFTDVERFLRYAVETVRRLSRHMHKRSANAGVLCILCTPGHRWWNKRLWLYFSSSTVICIFMSFPKKKNKKKRERKDPCDVRFHLCWCTIKQFFLGWNHWKHKKKNQCF